MNKIETQAKNEVHELLEELVVLPVTSDVKDKISSVESSLSKQFGNQTKEIRGQIGVVISSEKKMSEEFTEKINEFSESIEGLGLALKPIRKIESLDNNLSEIKEHYLKIDEINNNIKDLNECLGKVRDILSGEISKELEEVNRKIAKEAIILENLNQELHNAQQRVINIEELCHTIPQTVNTCQTEIIANINNSASCVKADVKSVLSELYDCKSNVLHVKSELANLRKKTRLFCIMLVLSIINSIGLFSILYILLN